MARPDNKSRAEIAERLALTRRALGYDLQTDFADALSSTLPMSLQRWNNYESGRERVTVDVALALCARFDLSLDWIYRGKRGELPSRVRKAIEDLEAHELRRSRFRAENGPNGDPSPSAAE